MAEFKKLINPPIKASEIDSESATQGQVLTANGTGGATWQDPSGGGTEVVANPSLAGTESDLTGLEVAGTKYKVPTGGGKQLYSHNIVIQLSKGDFLVECITNIINDTNTRFTYTSLHDYVYNISPTNHSKKLVASGSAYEKASATTYNLAGLGEDSSGKLTAIFYKYNGSYFQEIGIALPTSIYINDMRIEI